jgi:hypothetical protein
MLRSSRLFRVFALSAFVFANSAQAQTAQVRYAAEHHLPEVIDGNTSSFWHDGVFTIFHSSGVPTFTRGASQFDLGATQRVDFRSATHHPVWFEAVHYEPPTEEHPDGILLLWYHHEPGNLCPGSPDNLTAPKIGAAISYDRGQTVEDLGIILSDGNPLRCDAQNGFFAGGHGDMSVVLDKEKQFFYFFFTNYGGPAGQQGVATARLPYERRYDPVGQVLKFYEGKWEEPGVGGNVTPIFPSRVNWQDRGTDSHWGPSVHYNTSLDTYVILMNRACCGHRWPQEGVYVTFNKDLVAAGSWKQPMKILSPEEIDHAPGYYPQVLGLEADGTDSRAGRVARLYVHGISKWEIEFFPEDVIVELPDDSVKEFPPKD